MDAAYAEQIRLEVAKRLTNARASLPALAMRRAARTMVGVGRGSAVALGLALAAGEGKADIDAISAAIAEIGQLKGVTMKIGQLLGYIDVGLPESLRIALSVLQTHAQPMSFAQVKEIIIAELGGAGQDLIRGMRPEPISAASIGQVHPATLPDGVRVAVKVVYPHIADTIAQDFGPMTLSGRIVSWVHPRASLKKFVQEVRARVLEETNYALEARRQERFRELFTHHRTIVVPSVHRPYSSGRVLTTTFVEGMHLDAWLATNPSAAERTRASETLFEFYLGTLFRQGTYVSDPHPGNYLFMPDGRMAFVDFGSCREFDAAFVGRLAALTDAVRKDEPNQIRRALIDLGVARASERYEHQSTRWLLRAFYGPMLHDEVVRFDLGEGLKFGEVFRRFRKTQGLALPGELVFLLRTSLGLSSVLSRIGARANWYKLMQDLLDVTIQRSEAQTPAVAVPVPPVVSPPHPLTSPPTPAWAVRADAEGSSGLYDVMLIDPGTNVIEVLRQIRDSTGLGLREAKDLIDDCPKMIRHGVPLADAQSLRARLENAGARVEVSRVLKSESS